MAKRCLKADVYMNCSTVAWTFCSKARTEFSPNNSRKTGSLLWITMLAEPKKAVYGRPLQKRAGGRLDLDWCVSSTKLSPTHIKYYVFQRNRPKFLKNVITHHEWTTFPSGRFPCGDDTGWGESLFMDQTVRAKTKFSKSRSESLDLSPSPRPSYSTAAEPVAPKIPWIN